MPPCNAPTGLNDSINLYGQLTTLPASNLVLPVLPVLAGQGAVELNVRAFAPNGGNLNLSRVDFPTGLLSGCSRKFNPKRQLADANCAECRIVG